MLNLSDFRLTNPYNLVAGILAPLAGGQYNFDVA